MEKKLKMLFDYQRFERNARLETLIQETETHYAKELSDEDLIMVAAAGEMTENMKKPGGDGNTTDILAEQGDGKNGK